MAVDVLLVLGYGPVEGGGRLNIYARITALAAGMLLKRGNAQRLLITGGKTGGKHLPSEAALMAAYLTRMFDLESSQIILEEHAFDTLENLALSTNLLDRVGFDGTLGFLALGLHLPRIRYIADVVGLEGQVFAAESLVATRSARHLKLLENLRGTSAYGKLAASQVRAMRGLETLPSFWLPPLGKLENPERLRRIQRHPAIRDLGLPEDMAAFREVLRTMPRHFPEPHPDDERRGLALIHV